MHGSNKMIFCVRHDTCILYTNIGTMCNVFYTYAGRVFPFDKNWRNRENWQIFHVYVGFLLTARTVSMYYIFIQHARAEPEMISVLILSNEL